MQSYLQCGKYRLDLSVPHVMGILNATPDSFSDGGQYNTRDASLSRAEAMLEAGASILDVGGESTRPGAQSVTPQQELDRVAPLVEALVTRFDCIVSVDTSAPQVMVETAALGAGFADSSHFSRAFRNMFGITPSSVFGRAANVRIVIA